MTTTSLQTLITTLLITTLLSACTPSQPGNTSHPSTDQSWLSESWLETRYQPFHSKAVLSFLDTIQFRLLQAERFAYSHPVPELQPLRFKTLLGSTPFAYSSPHGSIVVSSGLLLKVKNEAELAFVLAHEAAHFRLGHTENWNSESSPQEEKERELQADRTAIGLIALAGYDPRASIAVVQRLQGWNENSSTHPQVGERLRNIELAILTSGWRPPGRTHSRRFLALQQTLAHQLTTMRTR